jgi:hemoglobin-like flavoprotein
LHGEVGRVSDLEFVWPPGEEGGQVQDVQWPIPAHTIGKVMHMLSAAEVLMVQDDWKRVVPIASTAANLFYDKLFELDPTLRGLFSQNLTEQKKKLVQMIGVAVAGLNDLPKLVPAVRDLGRRHVGYGVKAEHYATVGSALLWTLRQGLGTSFDADHEAAWAKVYDLLATTMQTPAAAAEPAATRPRASLA